MMDEPLVVSYGGGTNSTAMLIGMADRDIHPDLILFADTGGEHDRTYAYVERFSKWCQEHHGIAIATVKRDNETHKSLEDECWNNGTLPSLAFGFKGCSVKWKRHPMDKYVRHWPAAEHVWQRGGKVTRAIGIDADESHRGKIPDDKRFRYVFPLMEWGWGRDDCLDAIDRAGLPRPGKSACWFCPAMKKHEVLKLASCEPEKFDRAVAMERNAREVGGLQTIKGLGRHWSWEALAKADKAQLKMFPDATDEPCMCFDGDE